MPEQYQAQFVTCVYSSLRLYLALFLSLFISINITSAEDLPPAVPGEYIIKFNTQALEELQNDYPEMRDYSLDEIKAALHSLMGLSKKKNLGIAKAELSKRDGTKDFNLDFLLRAKEYGLIEYIEPNYRVKIDSISNDPYADALWGLNNTGQNGATANVDIDAPEAWSMQAAKSEVVVGIVDTGVDYNHPDLVDNIWHNEGEIPNNGIDDDMNGVVDDYYGFNALNDNGDPFDNNEHGTHVSGTIAAIAGNGKGVAGVANNVKIMALKFLDADGFGASSDAVEAIEYAINAKLSGVNIRVLNNSWAGESFSKTLYNTVQDAAKNGILFVASAGNSKNNNDYEASYPANFAISIPDYGVTGLSNVVSVAAITNTGYLASFSNYGANAVHVTAPGVSILSTIPGNKYAYFNGTSMAAPHVSGVAAMLFGKKASYSPSNVRSILISSSKHLKNLEGLVKSEGVISASAALGLNANEAPVIKTISTQTLYKNGPSKTIAISASDSNGDALTYSATLNPVDYQAYRLDSELDFWTNGEYYINSWGYQEKWFRDKDSKWYFITPNANIFRVDTVNQTPMVAILGATYYDNPQKLLNAAATYSEPATLSLSGNKLTITPATDYTGEFTIRTTVSDGTDSTYQDFTVKVVKNYAPKIAAISDKVAVSGYRLVTRLYTSDADNDNVTVSASSSSPDNLKVTTSKGYIVIIPQGDFIGDVDVTVNATDGLYTTNATFKVSVISKEEAGSLVLDQDNDGVLNYQELEDGTDPTDPGSYNKYFNGTAYGLWNGYLGMSNILELSNSSFESCKAYISLYSKEGKRVYYGAVTIKKQSQSDFELNKFKGFKANSFGIIKVAADCALEGRTSYYRPNLNGEYEFAFSVPIGESVNGQTTVSFNTFQPSYNSEEKNNVVQNWLSIVNLASKTKRFRIYSYNSSGKLIRNKYISVSPLGRVDIDGGHGFAGINAIGLHRIVPTDKQSPYLAQLMRYGTDAGIGQNPSAYTFAYPILARAGSGRELNVMVSHAASVDNWVEIANSKDKTTSVLLEFRNSKGYLLKSKLVKIAPYAQKHFNVADFLPIGENGILSIDGNLKGAVIAHSMYYYRDATEGRIQTMYGVRAQEAVGQTLTGSFNLYMNMENWLKVSNTTEETVAITVQVNNSNSSIQKKYYLNAYASLSLPLHDRSAFKTSASSFGLVFVQANQTSSVISELLRVKSSTIGNYEFISPTVLN